MEYNSSQHPANARRANITRQISQPVRNTGTPSLPHGTGHEHKTPSRNLAETKSHSRAHKSEHGTGQLDAPQSATSSHRRAQLAHSGTVVTPPTRAQRAAAHSIAMQAAEQTARHTTERN